jgi:hypothetical protein
MAVSFGGVQKCLAIKYCIAVVREMMCASKAREIMCATMEYTDTLRTQIIHSFNTEGGHEIITGNSITVGDIKVKINKSEWETYLNISDITSI